MTVRKQPVESPEFDGIEPSPQLGPKKKTGVKSTVNPSNQAAIDKQLAKIANRIKPIPMVRKMTPLDTMCLQQSFPQWDDDNRGVPNPFVRSGLFSVRNSQTREFLPSLKVPSLSNYQIKYTGQELNQDDLSVWMSLINLTVEQTMSDSVFFTGYSLVKDLGWSMNSSSYKRAQESISRLKVTGIELIYNNGDDGYSGSLIREYAWSATDTKGDTKWMVSFEPRIFHLFAQDTTTLLEWEIRKKIGSRATVAQWLHSFYSTHRDPLPISISKLYEMSRSDSTLSTFRTTIKRALDRLIEVEFLTSHNIVNDVLTVRKSLKVARAIEAKRKLSLAL
jgi:TrfA protein